MVDRPERVSPLDGVAEPGSYNIRSEEAPITLSPRLPETLLQFQAWPDSVDALRHELQVTFGLELPGATSQTCVTSGTYSSTLIMPSGPGRYLVELDDEIEAESFTQSVSPEIGAVTDLTHGRVVVDVSGKKADWLLASGFALDFHPSAFPVGDVRLTRHHDIAVTIHREAEDRFALSVVSSFARAFWAFLTRSALEVGYRVE